MEIFKRPPTAKGPARTFTGDVWVDGIYAGPSHEQARLAVVWFAPGARTHWHSHRLGQTLHILDGVALLGSRDGSPRPSGAAGSPTPTTRHRAPAPADQHQQTQRRTYP